MLGKQFIGNTETNLETADKFGFLLGLSFVLKKKNDDTYMGLNWGASPSPGGTQQCLNAFFSCPHQEKGGAACI